jgi:cytochrome P450
MLPPGPRTPALYNTIRFALRPHQTIERWHARYGDALTARFAFFGVGVAIADPAAIRELFTGDQSDLLAGHANGFMTPIVGEHSLLTLDGPEHIRQRRLIGPSFQGARVTDFRAVVREAAEREVDGWRPGQKLVLRDRMRSLTFEVICRAVFGVTERERIDTLRAALVAVIDSSWMLMAPSLLQRSVLRRRVRAADALLYEEIERRRGEPDLAERTDVLSLLMNARDENGAAMTDRELRDELVTLLGAGHETTATSLAFGLELLMRHPHELERLREAIAMAPEGSDPSGAGDARLAAVMRETMRVRPVIDAVERTLTKPRTVAGWDLPAGIKVYPSILMVHKLPELYEEPHAFRPDRWLDREPESYSWLPFGGGIRRCIGAALAQAEFIEALRVIVTRAELEPLRKRPDPVVLKGVTLAPRYGVRVRVASVHPFEQVLDDSRGGAPDQVAVDGVGGGLERDPLPH